MPCLARKFIDLIKFFSGFYPSKMFNFANNLTPLKDYTANLFLPLARLALITFLPFFVFILVLNPCVLFLGVLWGWYVLFIVKAFYEYFYLNTELIKVSALLYGRDFTLICLK